jgi:hypothetical protein
MQFFAYEHLPERLQEVSRPFAALANNIVAELPRNPERTVALRKLLEARTRRFARGWQRSPSMDDQEMIEQIARVCHEANYGYRVSLGEEPGPHWDEAPDWQKVSVRNGVQLHLDDPDTDVGASHAAWLEEKRATGWKWGPEKDPERKLHPCFLPFDQLPPEQQMKDHLFRAIVHAFNFGPLEVAE